MYCGNCGATIQPGQNFCNHCGQSINTTTTAAPAASAPTPAIGTPEGASSAPAPYSSAPQAFRVAKHLQILGILWIVASFLRLIPALGMMFFSHVGFRFVSMPLRGFLMPFIGGMAVFIAVTALVGFLVGWALIDRRPWARVLAIVFGCLKLIEFPFGTALGIYTLWVLASPGADREYQRIARVA